MGKGSGLGRTGCPAGRITSIFPGMGALYGGVATGIFGAVAAGVLLHVFNPFNLEGLAFIAAWLTLGLVISGTSTVLLVCRPGPELRMPVRISADDAVVAIAPSTSLANDSTDAPPWSAIRGLPVRHGPGLTEVHRLLAGAVTQLERNAQRLRAACTLAFQINRTGRPLHRGWRGWALSRLMERRTGEAGTIARIGIRQVSETQEVVDGLRGTVAEIGDVVGLIGQIAQESSVLTLDAVLRAANSVERGGDRAAAAAEVRDMASHASHSAVQVRQKTHQISVVSRRTVTLLGEVASTIQRISDVVGEVAADIEQKSHAVRSGTRPGDGADGGPARAGHPPLPGPSPAGAADADPDVLRCAGALADQAAGLRGSVAALLTRLGEE